MGAIEERDSRPDSEQHHYCAMERAGIPTFYPPPERCVPGELRSGSQISHNNAMRRSDLDRAEDKKRRNIYIELNVHQSDVPFLEVVEMRMWIHNLTHPIMIAMCAESEPGLQNISSMI